MQLSDFSAKMIDGSDQPLSAYAGRVVLVVNVASQCGFTPQYEGLEALWSTYQDRGLVVLGFPCNQFGRQEPGDSAQIKQFCSLNFGVSFPMFTKVDVNGTQAHPLWRWLKNEKRGLLGWSTIKWNFTKFLIGKDGKVIARYAPRTKPDAIAADIEKALAA